MSEPITKEAMEFIQTDRTGWVTKMSVREITQLLPGRDLEQLPLFTETNRPISENHLRGIARYLEETPNWAMPSIVLATDVNGIGNAAARGTIEIQPESLRILDGQHRVQALSNFTAVTSGRLDSSSRRRLRMSWISTNGPQCNTIDFKRRHYNHYP